ncbi:YnfA family protein [Bacillus subtilis subsp. subtilis]|nr:YnfA family protein [Bacillus subtilis subsp. subtilis]
MLITILLFLAAGLAEIGGGYLVWLWLREAKPAGYGIAGALILIVYGILPTFQSFPSFGRVYAAYGGVFIVLAVLWGWLVDRKTPDLYDWIGAFICLIGVCVLFYLRRADNKMPAYEAGHFCLILF